MNIEYAPGKARNEDLGQNAHEARKHNQVGFERCDLLRDPFIKRFAFRKFAVIDNYGFGVVLSRDFQSGGIGVIADYRNYSPGKFRVQQRTQIAAAPGYQYDDAFHAFSRIRR